jgi:hypothetical protein
MGIGGHSIGVAQVMVDSFGMHEWCSFSCWSASAGCMMGVCQSLFVAPLLCCRAAPQLPQYVKFRVYAICRIQLDPCTAEWAKAGA